MSSIKLLSSQQVPWKVFGAEFVSLLNLQGTGSTLWTVTWSADIQSDQVISRHRDTRVT
jgi:hypothetical protein